MKKSFFICLFAFISIALKAQIYSENISTFTFYNIKNEKFYGGLLENNMSIDVYYNDVKNITSIDIVYNNKVILHKLFYNTYVFNDEKLNADIAIYDIINKTIILYINKLYVEALNENVNMLNISTDILSIEEWTKIQNYFKIIKVIN